MPLSGLSSVIRIVLLVMWQRNSFVTGSIVTWAPQKCTRSCSDCTGLSGPSIEVKCLTASYFNCSRPFSFIFSYTSLIEYCTVGETCTASSFYPYVACNFTAHLIVGPSSQLLCTVPAQPTTKVLSSYSDVTFALHIHHALLWYILHIYYLCFG